MTEPAPDVTVADTVRWLHEEGLARLAGVAARSGQTVAAYTVDVATGTITAYPVTDAGAGADVMSLAADDLPYPVGTPRRLVAVGVTTADTVLVVDLAATLAVSIDADRPEQAARSWVLQLLLNPEVTITTNSSEVAIGGSARLRRSFIPGGGATLVNVDDTRPPVTSVTLNATSEGGPPPDRLEVAPDGTGEMYLGARFWQLRGVLRVADAAWTALAARLDSPADYTGISAPAERLSESNR